MTNNAYFSYANGTLMCENVKVSDIAKQIGTPVFVYSANAFRDALNAYQTAAKRHASDNLSAMVCYSVKSNSNIAILNLLSKEGSGFDIVSGGELARVVAAGGDTSKVVFSGVGKTEAEIEQALSAGINCFNIESRAELYAINTVAGRLGKKAPVSFRVNPNVDPKTHKYISTGLKENKFGIPFEEAVATYKEAAALPNISVIGIDCHIGSQLLDDSPLLEALDKILAITENLLAEGIVISHIDMGGGIGITYNEEKPVAVSDYLDRLFARIKTWQQEKYGNRPLTVVFEPGRSVSGNSGILVTKVLYTKENSGKRFTIVDTAMNDLMRPALYESFHGTLAVEQSKNGGAESDLVGPICESGDWLARARALNVGSGDLVALMSAGAYGMSMSSNYNTRPRAAEILVDGDKVSVIRKRETLTDLFAHEAIPSDD